MTTLRHLWRDIPVSLALLLLLWVLREVIGPDTAVLHDTLGVAMPWQVTDPHLFTASWTSPTRAGAVLATLGIVALAAPAEKVLGSRRFLLVVAANALLIVPLALLASRAVEETELNRWGSDLLTEVYLSPAAWIFGSAAWASAFMPVLWRRRFRLFLVAVSVTLMLYTGTVADIAAVTATLVGIAGGSLLHPRRPREGEWGGASVRERRVLIGVLLAAVAAGPVLAALNPQATGPFADVSSYLWEPSITQEEARSVCSVDPAGQACQDAHLALAQSGVGPWVSNLLPLLLQLVIILGLLRGRRLAWWLALGAQVLTIGVIIAQLRQLTLLAGDELQFSVTLLGNILFVVAPWIIALTVLLVSRRYFRVRIDARRLTRAGAVTVIAAVSTGATWLLGARMLADTFHPHATWSLVAAELPHRFLPPALASLYQVSLIPLAPAAWGLYEWVGNIFWLVFAAVLYRLLLSVPDRRRAAERDRAEKLLRSGTGDHLSWMTLWAGNRYWFAAQEAGYVGYRVRNGVAVTIGAPIIAATGNTDDVAAGFEAFAAEQGWQVAWYSVPEEFAAQRPGFQRVHVAEESVLSTENTQFTGKHFQNIRTARNRAGKEGVTTVWTTWEEASLEMREKIIALSEEWVADKALPEMGFTLGAIPELAVPGTRLLLAVDDAGRVHGVTSWLPVYENGAVAGLTLDFMRRDASGFRPVIEFLLAEALVSAGEEGLAWISLSGAPLATAEVMEAPGLLDVALDKVGETMEPLYGFRSLAASKDKFRPQHHSWFLCYRDELSLPAIGLAVSGCYLPQLSSGQAVAALRAWVISRRSPEG